MIPGIPIVELFGIPVANLSMDETLDLIRRRVRNRDPLHHIVINAGKVVAMQKDEQLRRSVLEADLINADGISIVWASKILGKPLKERVAGIDLMNRLVENAPSEGHKIFLFGAREEVVSKVKDIWSEKYGPEIIAGYRNGYFGPEDEENIAKQIAASGADLLFVAISSPKKEIFLKKYKHILKNVPFVMGVGGSFDVVAGKTKRAPLWMQKAGLEWFYRLIQEPRRMWRRYLIGNAEFLMLLLKEFFRKSRNNAAS